ncbi:MAG: DapH/DapD/GlmU-related protein [Lutibacter sp.]|nr:DapH/DapD/GlmU-related protein [Lutibacter sp.]
MKFNNKNVFISETAIIGKNVKIGDNCSIYDNVEIKDNSIIANDCIIGEPIQDYYYNKNYTNPKTIIKENALIRSHTIIYCGCEIGENFNTGHRVTIREYTKIGKNCKIGTISDIQGHSEIGDFCWLHSNVHIGQNSKIGNFVFIYPYVVLTNDPKPPSNICTGPSIGDYSQIAVFSVLLPNVKIGKHCIVGAGSVVGYDVSDYKLAIGNPAMERKDVRDIKNKNTGESYYPWVYRFERGMPWENSNYDEWLKSIEND